MPFLIPEATPVTEVMARHEVLGEIGTSWLSWSWQVQLLQVFVQNIPIDLGVCTVDVVKG